jgi:hypothetical protein
MLAAATGVVAEGETLRRTAADLVDGGEARVAPCVNASFPVAALVELHWSSLAPSPRSICTLIRRRWGSFRARAGGLGNPGCCELPAAVALSTSAGRLLPAPFYAGAGPESGGLYLAPRFVVGASAAIHFLVRAQRRARAHPGCMRAHA